LNDLKEDLKKVIFCAECLFKENGGDGRIKRTLDAGVLKSKHKDGQLKESDIDSKGKARYHVYSTGGKRNFMFIMETPGNKKNNGRFIDYVENGKLKYKDDFDKYVELKQKNFLIWMNELGLFNDGNIVHAINEDIISENFFDRFHVTDVRKCADGITKTCFETYLKNEIEILNPKLIFCFGGQAWNQILKKYGSSIRNLNAEKISDKFSKFPYEITKISKVHGELFEFKINENSDSVYIIPCIHFSGTARNSAPRNSYMDYFKKGLTEYRGKQEK